MTKYFAVPVAVLALLLGLSLENGRRIESDAARWLQAVEAATAAAEREDWLEAREALRETREDWESRAVRGGGQLRAGARHGGVPRRGGAAVGTAARGVGHAAALAAQYLVKQKSSPAGLLSPYLQSLRRKAVPLAMGAGAVARAAAGNEPQHLGHALVLP